MAGKIAPIDKTSGIPLYLQIEERLRAGIAQGAWKVGDYLPTEDEMCLIFGVSRGPIRQALNNLVADGTVVRERRHGTRVIRGVDHKGLILVTPFRSIQVAGMDARAQVLELKEVATPLEILNKWGKRFKQAVLFERVILANEQPVAYARSLLPAEFFAGLMDLDLEHHGLMDVVSAQFGMVLTRLDESMALKKMPKDKAGLLKLPHPIIGLQVTLWQWADDDPIEHTSFWLEPEKSRFLITGLLTFEKNYLNESEGRAVLAGKGSRRQL